MRRMLVTGAAGFIGSNFVHYWVEHHPADIVVGLDALTYAGNLSNLESLANNERFTFIKGDIRDGEALHEIIKRDGIDTIVHFAAESHVDRSIASELVRVKKRLLELQENRRAIALILNGANTLLELPPAPTLSEIDLASLGEAADSEDSPELPPEAEASSIRW